MSTQNLPCLAATDHCANDTKPMAKREFYASITVSHGAKNAFPKFVHNLQASPHNILICTADDRNVRSGITAVPSSTKINNMVQKLVDGTTQERMNTRIWSYLYYNPIYKIRKVGYANVYIARSPKWQTACD
jgi:hypothetical protein